jgi:hypothetical protein
LAVAADALGQERFNKRDQCLGGFGDTYVCLFEFGPKVDSSNVTVIEARSSKVQHDTYREKHIYAKLTYGPQRMRFGFLSNLQRACYSSHLDDF